MTDQARAAYEALTIIAEWRLPATGQFWENDPTRPMSYESAYGSNGARDYMREVARQALAAHPKEQTP